MTNQAPQTPQSYFESLADISPARAQFLWSSLPARKESNPTGYTGAITWWRTTLSTLTSKGLLGDDKLVLVVDEQLRDKLRFGASGTPLSLGAVVVRYSQYSPLLPSTTRSKMAALG